ncbi:MAG: hypothetical protein GKS04_03840 [Candidatus Mycalebacterium zealandia]|nr:MAG: hypothetical protein GKS04_03840 [Candidatus Mycalebacterium zealandia]
MDRFLDNLTKLIVANVVLFIAGFIFLIVTVAFFGPVIAPLMNKLPW